MKPAKPATARAHQQRPRPRHRQPFRGRAPAQRARRPPGQLEPRIRAAQRPGAGQRLRPPGLDQDPARQPRQAAGEVLPGRPQADRHHHQRDGVDRLDRAQEGGRELRDSGLRPESPKRSLRRAPRRTARAPSLSPRQAFAQAAAGGLRKRRERASLRDRPRCRCTNGWPRPHVPSCNAAKAGRPPSALIALPPSRRRSSNQGPPPSSADGPPLEEPSAARRSGEGGRSHPRSTPVAKPRSPDRRAALGCID